MSGANTRVAPARAAAREKSGARALSRRTSSGAPFLITGGAGFVGCNIADRLAREGQRVRILDNLSRPGVEANVAWLKDRHGPSIEVAIGDVRNDKAVRDAVADVRAVFHLAAQVAVTTSVVDPRADFEVNALGTLNVLEAIRNATSSPRLVFASTNKVYGNLDGLRLIERGGRHEPADETVFRNGIGERQPLDFHSPYGCSKGAADQYVLDYARTYNVPAVVLRLSCMYGPRQFGTEDQGWVAHFLKSAIEQKPITVYGDGKQVRDVLYIEDAVDAFLIAARGSSQINGHAFNIGGGPSNTVSLLELIKLIARLTGKEPTYDCGPWRPGDQLYYVSDTRTFETLAGWRPATSVETGIKSLYKCLMSFKINAGGSSSAEGMSTAPLFGSVGRAHEASCAPVTESLDSDLDPADAHSRKVAP